MNEGCGQHNCKARNGTAKRVGGEAVCAACRETVMKYLAKQREQEEVTK